MTSSSKIILLINLFLLFAHSTFAQCEKRKMLVLLKNDSSEFAVLKRGAKLDVIAKRQTYSGRLRCLTDDAIWIDGARIGFEEIQILIDPKAHFKAQNLLAWPMMGVGCAIGGAGLIMATASPENDHEDHDDNLWIAGLAMTGAGAGLAALGYCILPKETTNDDFYYSPAGYRFIVMDKRQARELKTKISQQTGDD